MQNKQLHSILRFWVLCASLVSAVPLLADPIKITYPGPESVSGEDHRNDYFVALLSSALARFGDKYQTEQHSRGASSVRQLQLLAEGKVSVTWNLSDKSRDDILLPIRIPLDKGLIGWRVSFLNKDDQQLFSRVKTLRDLRPIPVGQVFDWQDSRILEHNGLNLVAAPSYPSTFKMLKQKRFRYFPRSVIEVWGELERFPEYDLSVDHHLIIRYPVAYYFYVNRKTPELAIDLDKGLREMINDGEFERIFNQYYGTALVKANLKKRRVIELENPFIDPENLKADAKFWLNPNELP
jgi:ABC-type amino acid transport substrate-binding protein